MKLKIGLAGLLVLFAMTVMPNAYAADTVLGSSCDVKIAGGVDKQDFLNFDRVLRAAIQSGDTATVAMLSGYPLAINKGKSSISIDTPATLQSQFDQIFPDHIRKMILNEKPEQVFCNWEGVMYGNGAVWVSLTGEGNATRYRIAAINLEEPEKDAKSLQKRKVDFVCVTDKYYVVIDDDDEVHYRYRAWRGSRALDEKPDMEISTGTLGSEGRGLCAYNVWTFKTGDTEFDVMGMGCGGDNPDEPKDASGQIQVVIKGDLKQSEWCHR